MPKKQESLPKISIFDVFLGSGRTIRNPTGLPGVSETSLSNHLSSKYKLEANNNP